MNPTPGNSPPGDDRPPAGVLGGLVAKQEVIVRTDDAIIVLVEFRVFGEGAVVEINAAARRGDRPYDEWFGRSDAQASALFAPGTGGPHPAAVEVDVDYGGADRPVLRPLRGHAGTTAHDLLELNLRFWLSPNPPPRPFDVVVTWPAAGIEPRRHQVDGNTILDAARRSQPYW